MCYEIMKIKYIKKVLLEVYKVKINYNWKLILNKNSLVIICVWVLKGIYDFVGCSLERFNFEFEWLIFVCYLFID